MMGRVFEPSFAQLQYQVPTGTIHPDCFRRRAAAGKDSTVAQPLLEPLLMRPAVNRAEEEAETLSAWPIAFLTLRCGCDKPLLNSTASVAKGSHRSHPLLGGVLCLAQRTGAILVVVAEPEGDPVAEGSTGRPRDPYWSKIERSCAHEGADRDKCGPCRDLQRQERQRLCERENPAMGPAQV